MNAKTYICYVYFMNVSVMLILTEGLPITKGLLCLQ